MDKKWTRSIRAVVYLKIKIEKRILDEKDSGDGIKIEITDWENRKWETVTA